MLSSNFHFKENDWTSGAALLHQILPEIRWQPGGSHLGVWIQPGNQIPAITVEAFPVTKTKEGPSSAQQCWSDANCFLWPLHHKYALQGQTIIKEYYRDVLSRLSCVMICGGREQSCGQQVIVASIMTILQHIPCIWFRIFWWKTSLLWFVRLLTLLIWLPVTSGCSPNSRGYRKEIWQEH